MNLDLGNLFSRAWKVTWNSKILWLFGVLAGLGSSGSSVNYNFRGPQYNFSPGQPSTVPPEVERFFNQLANAGPTLIAIGLAIVCVLFLISLLVFVLSLLGQAGLIGGARLADSQGHVTFSQAWEVARRNLWHMFLINLPTILLGLLAFVIAILFVIGIFGVVGFGAYTAYSNQSAGPALGVVSLLLVCLVPIICILALVGLALRIWIFFARFAVVLEDLAPMAAFRRAWNVFVANLASILILGIILVVAGAVFGFIISLPLIIAVVPVVAGAIGTAATGKAVSLAAGAIFALVCCVIYVPVLIVLRGVYETWATSAWTLAYEQFIGARPAAPAVPYPVAPGGATA